MSVLKQIQQKRASGGTLTTAERSFLDRAKQQVQYTTARKSAQSSGISETQFRAVTGTSLPSDKNKELEIASTVPISQREKILMDIGKTGLERQIRQSQIDRQTRSKNVFGVTQFPISTDLNRDIKQQNRVTPTTSFVRNIFGVREYGSLKEKPVSKNITKNQALNIFNQGKTEIKNTIKEQLSNLPRSKLVGINISNLIDKSATKPELFQSIVTAGTAVELEKIARKQDSIEQSKAQAKLDTYVRNKQKNINKDIELKDKSIDKKTQEGYDSDISKVMNIILNSNATQTAKQNKFDKESKRISDKWEKYNLDEKNKIRDNINSIINNDIKLFSMKLNKDLLNKSIDLRKKNQVKAENIGIVAGQKFDKKIKELGIKESLRRYKAGTNTLKDNYNLLYSTKTNFTDSEYKKLRKDTFKKSVKIVSKESIAGVKSIVNDLTKEFKDFVKTKKVGKEIKDIGKLAIGGVILGIGSSLVSVPVAVLGGLGLGGVLTGFYIKDLAKNMSQLEPDERAKWLGKQLGRDTIKLLVAAKIAKPVTGKLSKTSAKTKTKSKESLLSKLKQKLKPNKELSFSKNIKAKYKLLKDSINRSKYKEYYSIMDKSGKIKFVNKKTLSNLKKKIPKLDFKEIQTKKRLKRMSKTKARSQRTPLETERIRLRKEFKVTKQGKMPKAERSVKIKQGKKDLYVFKDLQKNKLEYFTKRKDWLRAIKNQNKLIESGKIKITETTKKSFNSNIKSDNFTSKQKKLLKLEKQNIEKAIKRNVNLKIKQKPVAEFKTKNKAVKIYKDGTVREFKLIDKKIKSKEGTVLIKQQEVLIKTKKQKLKTKKIEKLKKASTKKETLTKTKIKQKLKTPTGMKELILFSSLGLISDVLTPKEQSIVNTKLQSFIKTGTIQPQGVKLSTDTLTKTIQDLKLKTGTLTETITTTATGLATAVALGTLGGVLSISTGRFIPATPKGLFAGSPSGMGGFYSIPLSRFRTKRSYRYTADLLSSELGLKQKGNLYELGKKIYTGTELRRIV